jgi:hypothetical protein
MWRRLLLLGLIGAGVLSASLGTASAASSNGLITISPPLKQLTIAPGLLQATSTIMLTNTSASDIGVTIKTADFTPLSNGTILLGQHGPSGAQSGLAAWMSLPDGPALTIRSGQSADIQLLIDNRSDLAPGGHYGAVVFSTIQLGPNGPNKLAFNQQLTALFFVKKVGGDISKMSLLSLKADSTSGLPTTASTSFQSTGNVYVVPRGYIEVTDGHGKLVAKGLINPESTLIPQATTRNFDTILQPVANAQPSGRLKLTAYYRVDGETRLSSSSIYLKTTGFSRVKLIFVFIIATIILGMMVWFLRKKLSHKFSIHLPLK